VGIKVVPEDIVLNPLKIACWFMDDGTNSQRNKQIRIYTMSFQKEEVAKLIFQMETKFNIKCTINFNQGKPVLLVSCRSYFDFIELVKPYIIESMAYKISTNDVPLKLVGYGSYKLNLEVANEIRKDYNTGDYTQKKLGEKYGIKQCSISQIINRITYND
jgi:hypothetical protein